MAGFPNSRDATIIRIYINGCILANESLTGLPFFTISYFYCTNIQRIFQCIQHTLKRHLPGRILGAIQCMK